MVPQLHSTSTSPTRLQTLWQRASRKETIVLITAAAMELVTIEGALYQPSIAMSAPLQFLLMGECNRHTFVKDVA